MGLAYQSQESTTGTCTVTATAGPGVVWNLTSLSVSLAGPTLGPNGKVTVYDGTTSGTAIYAEYLPGPGSGSVGNTVECKIPKDAQGRPGLQGTPGNAMTIVVNGTGANKVIINARFSDGLP